VKPGACVLAIAMLALASSDLLAADGPAAAFNEAVRVVDGQRVVEVAPFPKHMQTSVSIFKKPSELANQVAVASIETDRGLMDCYITLWYHPKACSPSTFGKQVRYRTWVVLINHRWLVCASHLSAKSCVPIIVDGVLRPTPGAEE
jgi:hypothetical protein